MNIKVWIPNNEFSTVLSGGKPTIYWTDKPNSQDVISAEVSAVSVKSWGSPAAVVESPTNAGKNRHLLKD